MPIIPERAAESQRSGRAPDVDLRLAGLRAAQIPVRHLQGRPRRGIERQPGGPGVEARLVEAEAVFIGLAAREEGGIELESLVGRSGRQDAERAWVESWVVAERASGSVREDGR
jgi:hypothetical protein